MLANSNRNPKTKKTPFSPLDFAIYVDPDSQNLPSGAGASAYMQMAKDGALPSWALFCFADMKTKGQGEPPALLAYVCDDAILFAPTQSGRTYIGLLLAKESASNQKRKMVSPSGREIWFQLPKIETKFVAIDDQELDSV